MTDISSDNNNIYIIITKSLLIIIIIAFIFIFYQNSHNNKYGLSLEQKIKDYKSKTFSIIRRTGCPNCGFFSFYIAHLGCINELLSEGTIPIIDLKSFPNIYNKGNTNTKNQWELFFYQPYNYTLDEVEKYSDNINYYKCVPKPNSPNENLIYYNKSLISFWHNFAKSYSPIKNEIMEEAAFIFKKLFENSKNILGVKLKGTDYISLKPKYRYFQPKTEQIKLDVIEMNIKYKYDFIFLSTEDELIKTEFVQEFGNKLKLLNPNLEKKKLARNINLKRKIYGDLEFTKNYILNVIILSKCLDIITSRCCGAAAIFILTNRFRHIRIYN